eukprot:7958503-Alexandrium_andersonii.AAC.1
MDTCPRWALSPLTGGKVATGARTCRCSSSCTWMASSSLGQTRTLTPVWASSAPDWRLTNQPR